MLDDSLNKHPLSASWGIPAALFLGFCAYIAPQLSAVAIAPLVAGAALSQNMENFVLLTVIEFLTVSCVVLLVYSYGDKIRTLGFGSVKAHFFGQALIALGVYFIITIAVQIVVNAFIPVPDQPQDLGFSSSSNFEKIFIFIGLVALAPVAEETLFRGFIFAGLRRRMPFWLTTVIVSLLFGLVHGQLNVGLDVFVLSLVLCYLREHSGSLWPSIMLHSFKNSVAFVLIFILGVGG